MMYVQALMRCENCMNVWADRIIYDEKLDDYKKREYICPICQNKNVHIIAESV